MDCLVEASQRIILPQNSISQHLLGNRRKLPRKHPHGFLATSAPHLHLRQLQTHVDDTMVPDPPCQLDKRLARQVSRGLRDVRTLSSGSTIGVPVHGLLPPPKLLETSGRRVQRVPRQPPALFHHTQLAGPHSVGNRVARTQLGQLGFIATPVAHLSRRETPSHHRPQIANAVRQSLLQTRPVRESHHTRQPALSGPGRLPVHQLAQQKCPRQHVLHQRRRRQRH
mmetsp:Transcript_41983/g.115848  ORF Transcript_41983/g.115848 Transcript_41983/m.115848 type:complete len:225 (-) Transcript_41983:2302-2976(-)